MTTTAAPRDQVQRHVVRTLVGTQVLGGVGLSAGVAVGALLAEDVSGSAQFAGLGGTFQVLGAALIAIPMSRVMAARGRRPGLVLGYVLAAVGAVGLITAGVIAQLPAAARGEPPLRRRHARPTARPVMPPPTSRYPAHRARDLSIVVWATTVGSVIGPNLVGPSAPRRRALGLPVLTGPFLFSLLGLLLAVAVIVLRLRPGPAHRGPAAQHRRRRRLRPGPRLGDAGAAGRRPASPLPASACSPWRWATSSW